jgi:hypothetical protein
MDVSPYQYEGINEISLNLRVNEEEKLVTVFVNRYYYEMARHECHSFVSKMYPDYNVEVRYP